MRVIHPDDVPTGPVETEGAEGVMIQEFITHREGAPTFAMRRFEIAPGGHTPLHTHAWEHEVYILEGEGILRGFEGEKPFRTGDAVLVPPGEEHSFVNTGDSTLKFLCMVPVRPPKCS